jgi:prepilin-type N-terminal cleavage/methylation domain-containing protein
MKLQIPFPGSSRVRSQTRNQGFTLPEILIALTIFLFVLAGITFANLFGLRMFQVNETKLTVTRWSRDTIEKLTDQIHACNSVQVVNIAPDGSLETLLDGETRQGNGLLIYPTADTNNYTLYFVNLADQSFRRTDQPGTTVILAGSVTNTLAFSAQNFSGTVLTNNNNNNQVIHLMLEFYQPERFMQDPDYYKLETSVKKRVVQ